MVYCIGLCDGCAFFGVFFIRFPDGWFALLVG